MDKLSLRFLTVMENTLRDTADSAMLMPKSDVFEHGVQVGKWQGLEDARQLMLSLHKEADDEDSRL